MYAFLVCGRGAGGVALNRCVLPDRAWRTDAFFRVRARAPIFEWQRACARVTRRLSAGIERPGGGPGTFADQDARRLGSMNAGKANANATFDGVLIVTAPSGNKLEVSTTFDTGSDTDALSVELATKLIELGCSWGDAGGGIVMADGRETTPHGELRLMLSAEPKRKGHEEANNAFAIPRPLTFVTVKLMPRLLKI